MFTSWGRVIFDGFCGFCDRMLHHCEVFVNRFSSWEKNLSFFSFYSVSVIRYVCGSRCHSLDKIPRPLEGFAVRK